VKAHQASYSVATMCRMLEVSTSGFYAWLKRPASARSRSDAELSDMIKHIHTWSRGTYGVPRMRDELMARGQRVNHKRIARLMRQARLAGVSRRKGTYTTRCEREAAIAPDLVSRNFTANGPNQLWVADITYVPTWSGFLYLAVVMDAWSRRIVGWAMATHLRTELVLDALNMALWQRRPEEVIHHSDQGCQYTSLAFGKWCQQVGIRTSMGSAGDCFDNALCESFFATLECELIDRSRFRTQVEARLALFDIIEGWYNPHRRHSAINHESPMNFERTALAASA